MPVEPAEQHPEALPGGAPMARRTFDALRAKLALLQGEPDSEALRRQVERDITAAVSDLMADVSRSMRERPEDRATRRGDLAATYFGQMDGEEAGVRLGAAGLAAYMTEPFLFGIPEDFDPRAHLSKVPDAVLDAVCRRFAWGEGFPTNFFWFERMRRREQIADWDFQRQGEHAARVTFRPNKPAETIEISFAVSEDGEPLGLDGVGAAE